MANTITKKGFVMKRKLKLLIYLKKTGKRVLIILFSLGFLFFNSVLFAAPAEWTIVVYAQPNVKHLYSAMLADIKAMQQVANSPLVNILVQFCQPEGSITGVRYQVQQGKLINNWPNVSMGLNPGQEIVDLMQWAKTNFPANKYMLILSGDGNGTLDDQRNGIKRHREIFGEQSTTIRKSRGALYNSGTNTFLSNPALTAAINSINAILGKTLDVLGFDDCMMAGIEVSFQVQGLVKVMTASESTEPGIGYNYKQFLSAVVQNPTGIDARAMGKVVVAAYQSMYSKQKLTSLSAVDVTQIPTVAADVSAVVGQLTQLQSIQPGKINSLIASTSNTVQAFADPDYIDLNSFYTVLLRKSRNLRQTAGMAFGKALLAFGTALQAAQADLANAVIANYASSDLSGARGISIYWPTGRIDPVYSDCLFAQNYPSWITFIQNNKSAQ